MQQHSLLQTKLYIPPIRPELISRPRLIEQLNAGLPTRGGLSRTQDAGASPPDSPFPMREGEPAWKKD